MPGEDLGVRRDRGGRVLKRGRPGLYGKTEKSGPTPPPTEDEEEIRTPLR